MPDKQYSADDIRVLSDREHVRLRTSIYLGSTEPTTYEVPIFEKDDIKIKQKGIINLHNQLENPGERGWVKGRFTVSDVTENREFRAKFRSKGDRKIHFHSLNDMSYRVNIRGKDRLYGIEEFSLQKPIIRNYTWEYLFSSIAKKRIS